MALSWSLTLVRWDFPFSLQTLLKVIKWFLGGLDLGSNYGAVSSLAFNTDSTRWHANGSKEQINQICDSAPCHRLLGGFARGQLVEWDITTGKVGLKYSTIIIKWLTL